MKTSCPECGSKNTVRIIYGFPSFEMMDAAQRGDIKLGGCMIWPNQKTVHCFECEGNPTHEEKNH